jgi:hypothetical protein
MISARYMRCSTALSMFSKWTRVLYSEGILKERPSNERQNVTIHGHANLEEREAMKLIVCSEVLLRVRRA